MLNQVHQRYCLQRIDNFAIALIKTPGTKHYEDEKFAKTISDAYNIHLDVSRADSDVEEEESEAESDA